MKRLFLLPLLGCTLFVHAQSDSIRMLPEARVRDLRYAPPNPGKPIQSLPPSAFQPTLAGMLESSSAWTVRSYGPGLLTSLSVRGTGASHSPILWNGLNLQSAMNGQMDLNLIPAFFFDDVSLSAGTQNSFETGGILGGKVGLRNFKPHENRVIVGLDAGEFFTRCARLGLDSRRGKWTNRFRAFGHRSANNFPYKHPNIPDSIDFQQNAEIGMASVLNETTYESKRGYRFTLAAWWQDAERQIPPTLLSTSTATQEDENLRLNFSVEKGDSLQYWQFNSGYLAEHLWYHDPERNLEGYNNANTLINQFIYRRNWNKKLVQLGISHYYSQAGSSSYLKKQARQQRTSPYASLSGDWKKLTWKADLRQEFVNLVVPAPSWSLGAEYPLGKRHAFSAHVAQISRLPNLNDLNWNPGGNPDLQPEKGHSAELSYGYSASKKDTRIHVYANAFYSIIQNWIIWLPDGGFWTPQNLQEVHSRGGEWKLTLTQGKPHRYLRMEYGGSFTLASNEKTKTSGDLSVGKQLIYVPYWKNHLTLSYRLPSWEISYRHVFMGGRYTATDHSSFLRPYTTGAAEITYSSPRRNTHRVDVGVGVQNVWNTYYESIMLRPMPGRYIQISIDYQFIKKP